MFGAEPWLGIDIGTTYTRGCLWNPVSNSVELLLNEKGEARISSVVAFENNGRIIGSSAKIHRSGIVDVKKVLGRSFDDEDVQELKRSWRHKIVKGENNRCMISVDGLEGMKTAEELVADIIEALCKLAN